MHGYVIKGRWYYLEHDWVAETGSFVFEPPGEIHTLRVPEDSAEMITFFNISGAMIYLDDDGKQIGTRTSSPRSSCAETTTRPKASAPTTSTSSFDEADSRE